MKFQPDVSKKESGLYLVRTTSGFGGSEVGYKVAYWGASRWSVPHGETVTHFCVIEEPVPLKDTDVYQDPLGRLVIYAQGARGVDLNLIGPGAGDAT